MFVIWIKKVKQKRTCSQCLLNVGYQNLNIYIKSTNIWVHSFLCICNSYCWPAVGPGYVLYGFTASDQCLHFAAWHHLYRARIAGAFEKTAVRRTNAPHRTMHTCTWEPVTIISQDHMSMTWLWKSKQQRFMPPPPLSAYVVWLNKVQWLLTRHCADRCWALLSEKARTAAWEQRGGEWHLHTSSSGPHSLSLSSSWSLGVWFSPGRSGRFYRGWKKMNRPESSTPETEFQNKPEAGKSGASWGRCERAGDGWARQNFASKPQWRRLNVNIQSKEHKARPRRSSLSS